MEEERREKQGEGRETEGKERIAKRSTGGERKGWGGRVKGEKGRKDRGLEGERVYRTEREGGRVYGMGIWIGRKNIHAVNFKIS